MNFNTLREKLNRHHELIEFVKYYKEKLKDLDNTFGNIKCTFTTETFNGLEKRELEIPKKYLEDYINDELIKIKNEIEELQEEIGKWEYKGE